MATTATRPSPTSASAAPTASSTATCRPTSWSSTRRCSFHDEVDTDLDPVSYEVLRSKLWNVNWDHQETIRRVSGSQVVVYGYDFNTTIQTEDGAGVCFGPGNLFFGGCADVVVKWTLEHRSMNVGINEGDIFLQDDPWIGTNHQMDAAVYAPVFWEGKLFAWVYNVIHQRELGGVEPGGFTQQAHDVYAEPTFFPPMKLVDARHGARGRRRRLGAALAARRADDAGAALADRRRRSSPARACSTWSGATARPGSRARCAKMIDTTGQRRRRAAAPALPDGEWTDTRYVSGAVVGDLTPYKFSLTVRKEGDRLTYSNTGTDPSVGSFNITAGRAARLHHQLAAHRSSATTSTSARPGCSSRSTSSSSAARSPPPTTRPRSAPRSGWWWRWSRPST